MLSQTYKENPKLANRIMITIQNLGPVKDSTMSIEDLSVLIGLQAGGKSTITKVVYFFLTIKDDFASLFTLPRGSEEESQQSTLRDLKKRLREKFLGIFGATWGMPDDMYIFCQYAAGISIRVFLSPVRGAAADLSRNYVDFDFGDRLMDCICQNDKSPRFTPDQQKKAKEFFDTLFFEPFDVVYVPAGREMVTLLSDRLAYIFTDPDVTDSRSIDYCTQSFVRLVLKLRPSFENGTQGLLSDKLHLTTDKVDQHALGKLQDIIDHILMGRYFFVNGEEKIRIDGNHDVKLNFASSGQQESVWVLNLLYYYMLQNRRMFLIIEEPESHLYPGSQNLMTMAIAQFVNYGSQVMMTTNSPYILGALNNCLCASGLAESKERDAIIDPSCVISPRQFDAWFMKDGYSEKAMLDDLIDNDLIDGASKEINGKMDQLMGLIWKQRESQNG